MGLFTKPKNELEPDVFDRKNMLLKHVRSELMDWVYSIIPKKLVSKIFLLGSSAGYKWDNDSDIDLQVILAEGADRNYWFEYTRKFNGKLLPTTLHPMTMMPLNYQIPDWSGMLFECYDVTDNKWIVPPIPGKDLPDIYKDDKPDMVIANLYSDQIKNIFQELINDYGRWTATKDENWFDKVMHDLDDLANIFFEVDSARKISYQMGWGVPRYSTQNIVFKYIEKKKYLDMLQDLYHYFRDDKGEFVNTEDSVS